MKAAFVRPTAGVHERIMCRGLQQYLVSIPSFTPHHPRIACRAVSMLIYYYYAVEHHRHQQHTHACTLAGPATLLLRQRLRRVGGPRRRRARSSAKNQERSRLRPPQRGRGFFAKIGGERRLEGIGRKCVLIIAVVITIGGGGGEVRLDPGGRAQMAGRLREAVRAGRVNGEEAVVVCVFLGSCTEVRAVYVCIEEEEERVPL